MTNAGANRMSWTEADFETMGWHDCTIHGLRFEQDGEYQGDLVLDLDYITEWILRPDNSYNFRVAPAQLRFLNVDNLQIRVARRFHQAAEIDDITRASSHWVIKLHGYLGQEASQIEFDATGYVQELSRPAIVVDRQSLTQSERR